MQKKDSQTVARPGGKRERPVSSSERQFLEAVGAAIKKARVAKGITAIQLAAAIDLGLGSQFHRESGKVAIPIVDLYRYAKALGIPVADLLPPESDTKPRPKSKASAATSSDQKRGGMR